MQFLEISRNYTNHLFDHSWSMLHRSGQNPSVHLSLLNLGIKITALELNLARDFSLKSDLHVSYPERLVRLKLLPLE